VFVYGGGNAYAVKVVLKVVVYGDNADFVPVIVAFKGNDVSRRWDFGGGDEFFDPFAIVVAPDDLFAGKAHAFTGAALFIELAHIV
jgi:hypothetical protein